MRERRQSRDENGSSLDSARKGKAAELLVAASCILASEGELNVSTSFVDDEGVDLVFHRRGRPATLAVQVKSRFTSAVTTSRGQFMHDVRGQTFTPREDFYLLFLVINQRRAELELCWLVPSTVLAERVRPSSRGRLRFAASMKPNARDRWREFRFSKEELPAKLLAILAGLEASGQ